MKTSEFRRSDALWVQYRRPREGPPSFLIWEPHKSYICLTAEDVIKQTKWNKGTETGAALRTWLEEVVESTPRDVENEPIRLGEEGFGPDAPRES